jgi:hypothetical protein
MRVKEHENITLEERLKRCFEPVKPERKSEPIYYADCFRKY